VQGQIWNSLVNYVLLFIAVPMLAHIKPLKLYFGYKPNIPKSNMGEMNMTETIEKIEEQIPVCEERETESVCACEAKETAPICVQEDGDMPTTAEAENARLKLGEVNWRYSVRDKKWRKIGSKKWRYLNK
jgi:hypothetical protein